jgi:hypothetical protein
VLKHIKNGLSSVATLTAEFQTASGQYISTKLFVGSFMKWVYMARAAAQKPKITMCNTKRIGWSGFKLVAIRL